MIAGDHGCPPEWRKVSLAGRDLRKGQDGAKRMDFSESEVSQLRTVQVLPVPSQVALAAPHLWHATYLLTNALALCNTAHLRPVLFCAPLLVVTRIHHPRRAHRRRP